MLSDVFALLVLVLGVLAGLLGLAVLSVLAGGRADLGRTVRRSVGTAVRLPGAGSYERAALPPQAPGDGPPLLQHERPPVPPAHVLAIAVLLLGMMTLPVAVGYGLRTGVGGLLATALPAAAVVTGVLWLRALHRPADG